MDGAKKKPASALFYKRKRMSDQSDRVKKRLSKQRQARRVRQRRRDPRQLHEGM